MQNEIILISIQRSELESIIENSINKALTFKKEKELMSFKETLEFLNCSSSALNKWKAEGKIPYKKLGKRVFFNRKEIIDAMPESHFSKMRKLKCF